VIATFLRRQIVVVVFVNRVGFGPNHDSNLTLLSSRLIPKVFRQHEFLIATFWSDGVSVNYATFSTSKNIREELIFRKRSLSISS